jgi:large subunit ribosomal protein L31
MRENIHPKYIAATVKCACGHAFASMSTTDEIKVVVCSHCHPFFTGKQKLLDTAGRIEKFQKKYGKKA